MAMGDMPHLYKKLSELAKSYNSIDKQYEVERGNFIENMSRKFRLNKQDMRIVLKELYSFKQAKQTSQRKIRLP